MEEMNRPVTNFFLLLFDATYKSEARKEAQLLTDFGFICKGWSSKKKGRLSLVRAPSDFQLLYAIFYSFLHFVLLNMLLHNPYILVGNL